MICPFCREKDTSVVDSRPCEEGTAVRTQMITSIGFGMSSDAFYETFNQGSQGANW